MTKHTPILWETNYTGNVWGDIDNEEHDGDSPLLGKFEDEANAAYAVHCVNCHDELLEALKHLVAIVPDPPLVSMGFDGPPEHATQEDHDLGFALHLARTAIAKAAGEAV